MGITKRDNGKRKIGTVKPNIETIGFELWFWAFNFKVSTPASYGGCPTQEDSPTAGISGQTHRDRLVRCGPV